MRAIKPFVFSVLLLVCLSAVCAADVIVYTTSFLPVKNIPREGAEIYYLDDPEKPLAALSAGLPNNYDEATPVAVARINTEEGRRLLGELKRSYQGIVNAWLHKITDLPAILVDEQYVVYGVYDVVQAVALVDDYRGAD